VITRGWAVGFGQWFFFPDLAPAIAFGRAARMSRDCHSYGVFEAAREGVWCQRDGSDETVLLIGAGVDQHDDDLQLRMLKRFVQGVKEYAWSAHWHEPTGYLNDYNHGRSTKTRKKSLPL
jgi:hypothetical protein